MGRRCDSPPDNLIDFYEARELVGFDRFLHVQAWLNRGLARPAGRSADELRPAPSLHHKPIHAYLINYPVAIVLMVAPFLLKRGKSRPVALCFRW